MKHESNYICGFCNEPYGKERIPKFLPCFHTFCVCCLAMLEASVTVATPNNQPEDHQQAADDQKEQQTDNENAGKEKETAEKPADEGEGEGQSGDVTNAGSDVAAGGVAEKVTFPCPTCHAPVAVPKGGVAKLQTNFYLTRENHAGKPPPSVMCDMCDKSSQQPAVFMCQQCDMRMCPSCRGAHDRLLAGHHVTALGAGRQKQDGSGRRTGCLMHQGKELAFYCRQCDDSICLHCKLTSHEGHKTVDIAIAQAECQAEISPLLKEAEDQLQVVEASLRRAERDERELTCKTKTVTQQISSRYDDIMARVEQARDELMEDFAQSEEQERNQLRDQNNSISLTVKTLSALISRAERAGGPEVIQLKKELEGALLSEDQLEPHKQQAARQGAWRKWTYDVAEGSVEPVIALMGKLVEGGGCDVTQSPTTEKA